MKRILALVLAVLMVAALFAGCQKETPAPTAGNESTPAGEKETEAAKPTEPKEVVTISWYQPGGNTPPNQDSWMEKMNVYLEDKIGVHLDLHILPWSDYGTKTVNMITTNEEYDIVWGDQGGYRKNVNMNAFLDLTPYLDEVPQLKAVIPDAVWRAATINGGIYGVPAYKDVAGTRYWRLDVDFAEKYVPNYAECHDMLDFVDGMVAYKNDTGKLPAVTGGFFFTYCHYDNMGLGFDGYGVDMYADGAPKIVKTYYEDWTRGEYAKERKWIELGIMNDDGAVRKDFSDEDWVISDGQGWPSAWIGANKPTVVTLFQEPFINNNSCLGSMSHISSSSKHPLEALKLLEIVNTDTWVRDWLCYGEEGVNFEYVEENGEKKVKRLNQDWGAANFTQGQFFNETPLVGTKGNPMVDEVLVNNERALVSPLIGFYPDTTEIDDKLDEMRGISREFGGLINSTGDYKYVDAMYERMDLIGADEVMAELQRQLDEWWAAKDA